jgi:hypothetical protein
MDSSLQRHALRRNHSIVCDSIQRVVDALAYEPLSYECMRP